MQHAAIIMVFTLASPCQDAQPCNALGQKPKGDQKSKVVVAQELLDDYTQQIQSVSAALGNTKDEKSAAKTIEELTKNAKSVRENADKVRKIEPFTPDEYKRLSTKAFQETQKAHTEACRKYGAFVAQGTLSDKTQSSLQKALLEWSAANFAVSDAWLAVEPPVKKKKT